MYTHTYIHTYIIFTGVTAQQLVSGNEGRNSEQKMSYIVSNIASQLNRSRNAMVAVRFPQGLAMPSLEMRRISKSFATIVACRNETRGSNFHIMLDPVLKCLATGWLASLPMTARRWSPNLVLKGLPCSFFNTKHATSIA